MTNSPEADPYTLDFLMNEDPLNLTREDLDTIIAYHRKLRAQRAAGTARASAKVNKASVKDLVSMVVTARPGGGTSIKRRV